MASDSSLHIMHPRPFVVGVFLLLYDALPAGPTPCALHTSGSMFAKHGFLFLLCSIEVSLVFWTGVFLSPGRRICVTGKETGPGPGGYG